MSLLPISIYPDPVLRQKAERVENIDDSIQRLIDNMIETMHEAPGIGLAANQVGRPVRVVVLDVERREPGAGLLVLINPELISATGKTKSEEGCLSIPGYFASVTRHQEVVVRGLDRQGQTIEIAADGLLSIALQHEMDHLEGKLFIDRISAIARDIFKRRWKKKLREEGAEPQLCLD
ncbi:MAG: peptide deformylase [Deltaproteobacteria bacterium]|nr:peptide deformylase [Deltaproteobacteria bacterium]MDA8308358.1 peptide deformylase [Deltaproteobacteria bacterium]